jgi:hypothetical protein
LTATVTPSNATYKTVIWVSSNSNIASVNNGKVTAINSGTAVITASTVEGTYTATCTVNVREPTVLLDLAAKLQTLGTQDIDTLSKFNAVFSGLPLASGGGVGSDSDITYSIITESGTKKLQFKVFALWGPGLDITDSGIDFRAGDIIEVKGKIQNIRTGGMVLNLNNSGWDQLQGWYSSGEFENTFTLTASDVSKIKSNTTVRIRPDGVDPYSGRDPNGIAIITLEQIKVYRIE